MKPHLILKTFTGSQTGHDHYHFAKGDIADLSDDLAAIVVKAGWAEPHHGVEGEHDIEEKALEEAPANKMIKAAPANKGKK